MLKIRRPLGRLIFNMGIAIPGKTVFLIETAPRVPFQYPIRRLIVRSREWPRTLYYHGIGSMIAEYSLSNNIPGYFRMNFPVECVFKNSITLNQRYLGKSETKPLAKKPEHRYGNRHLKTMNRYSLWNNLLSQNLWSSFKHPSSFTQQHGCAGIW